MSKFYRVSEVYTNEDTNVEKREVRGVFVRKGDATDFMGDQQDHTEALEGTIRELNKVLESPIDFPFGTMEISEDDASDEIVEALKVLGFTHMKGER